ncbi:unnamed protein product [Arctogadus glacialis]
MEKEPDSSRQQNGWVGAALHGEFSDPLDHRLRYSVSLTESALTVQMISSQPARSKAVFLLADCVGCHAYTERDGDGGNVAADPGRDGGNGDAAAYFAVYFYPFRGRWMSGGSARQKVEQVFRVVPLPDPAANLREAQRWARAIRDAAAKQIPRRNGVVYAQVPRPCRLMVLLNPQSGRGQAMQLFTAHVQNMLIEAGVPYTLVITDRRNHAREVVRKADLRLWDALVIMSGDGLLFERDEQKQMGTQTQPEGAGAQRAGPERAGPEGGTREGGTREGGTREGGTRGRDQRGRDQRGRDQRAGPERAGAQRAGPERAGPEGGTREGGSREGGTREGGTREGGTREGGSTEGGTREGGTREGGSTEGGTREGGTRGREHRGRDQRGRDQRGRDQRAGPERAGPEGGSTEGGTREGGTREGGTREGGTREGGTREGGTREGGTREGGTREGGTREGGTREGGSTEGGTREGGTRGRDQRGRDQRAGWLMSADLSGPASHLLGH